MELEELFSRATRGQGLVPQQLLAHKSLPAAAVRFLGGFCLCRKPRLARKSFNSYRNHQAARPRPGNKGQAVSPWPAAMPWVSSSTQTHPVSPTTSISWKRENRPRVAPQTGLGLAAEIKLHGFCTRPICFRAGFTESQNARGWQGPLWVPQPNPLPKQGHPQQAAQHRLHSLQRRRLHSLPGQPGPGLHHPQSEVLHGSSPKTPHRLKNLQAGKV